jgi:aryl-alcohol dehydrogenase-like predicted oxidoreductase
MGMSEFYGPGDQFESEATIDRALDLGVTFFDTSDIYGPFTNEELVGRALLPHRRKVQIATKFGIVRKKEDPAFRAVDSSAAYIRSACETSLQRLGVETIDLYYQHRVDPKTPIEETVGAMARLVEEGKVRYLGLSEAGPETIRRAHATHPITALQTEYSLWSREPEEEILPTVRELGIGFVAYSPLGRGFLTGQIKRFEDLAPDDFRRNSPRFQGENFDRNLALVKKVEEMAASKGVKASQLALAWVLAQGQDVIAIPGTKQNKRMMENIGAVNVKLTDADFKEISDAVPKGATKGTRYPEAQMASLYI